MTIRVVSVAQQSRFNVTHFSHALKFTVDENGKVQPRTRRRRRVGVREFPIQTRYLAYRPSRIVRSRSESMKGGNARYARHFSE